MSALNEPYPRYELPRFAPVMFVALLTLSVVLAANWSAPPVRAGGTLAIAHSGLPDPIDHGEETLPVATDWNAEFARLRANGVTAFFPHTDSIAEFVTTPDSACDLDGAAFAALRANDMRLIVPGFVLYPPGWLTQNLEIWNLWFDPGGAATPEEPPEMPAVPDVASAGDPLRRLIACAGGAEQIYAVTSYDEPAFLFDGYDAEHRIDAPVGLAEVEALYRRVKAVSAETPVMMVHAPIPRAMPDSTSCIDPPPAGTASSPWSFVTPGEWVSDYLARVEHFSVWADWVGFDLYPVPDGEVSRIITDPDRGGLEIERYDLAVDAYLRWLAEHVDKPRFLVSQGFSYARNPEVTDTWCLSAESLRDPTRAELDEMNRRAQERGAFLVLYWGIHLLQAEDVQPGRFYDTMLAVSSKWGR